jgi:transposase
MTTLFVGLDLGSRNCQLAAMNAEGSVTINRCFPTSEANLLTAVKELGGNLHVHIEAGELAAWVRSVLAPRVARLVVGHPCANAWIAKDPNKSDRVDARKLADLLRLNRLHEVYYPEEQSRRDFKLLVQHYDDLTAEQVRLKQKIKSRLRVQGVIIRNARPFTAEGRVEALAQVGSADVRAALLQLYDVLDQTLASQLAAQRLMLQAAKSFPEVALFEAVPGMGPIGSCRFSAYLQTPHRFSNVRKLWRYCRLGVSHRSSDGKRIGRPRLDRAGCGRLKDVTRKAFTAALRSKGDNAFKRAYALSLERTHSETHARLNVQRKFASVLRAMWLQMSPYRDEPG